MEQPLIEWIEAEFTKINFLLEALWAHALVSHGASPPDVDALAKELQRQMLTLPGTLSSGGPAPANDEIVTEMAAARMARFFDGVQARVKSARRDPHR